MIAYTTKEFYEDKYLMGREAVVDTAVFPFYALKATQVIKQYTFGNVDENEPIQEVQMCCCELAEHLYNEDNKDHDQDVQSEKKGEWSTTYVAGQEAKKISQSKINEIIKTWLGMTGLLYRGCY